MSASVQQTQNRQDMELAWNEDFITIIAPTLAEVMDSFRAQGLAAKHYTIVHRVGRHSFRVAGGSRTTTLFDGSPMIAATFARRA